MGEKLAGSKSFARNVGLEENELPQVEGDTAPLVSRLLRAIGRDLLKVALREALGGSLQGRR
jgi:hypothetical protein